MKDNNMNDKKRSLRMRNINFSDLNPVKGFGGMKASFFIPPPLNLSNRTITAFDLQGKTNFKNAIFIGSTLNDIITFKNFDFTGANFLKATLNGVIFENCNLTRAVFSSAKLNKNTSFINCNLSNSFFVESGRETEVYSVIFKSCTFTGANFSGAQIFKNAILNDETFKNDENFKNVDFTGANFLKATLNSVRFESCILTGVNFTEANLYTKIIKSSSNTEDSEYTYIYTSFVNIDKFNNAVFKKAKLYGVSFENCNLTKADFSEAQLTVISYEDKDEEYTVFNKVNLKEANFTSADLYSVSFIKNVNLRKANFTEAKLTDSYLGDFDVFLEDTLFIGATIENVNFLYANYFGDPEDIDYEYEDIQHDYLYNGVKNLSGLDFSSAELENVNLAYSIFENVNFLKARLINVNLAYSDLAYSNFSEAIIETNDDGISNNLDNTSFDYADLSGAQIINLSSAIINNNTRFDGANLENVYFNNWWFRNLFFDVNTHFGVNKGVSEDTRTTFKDCFIEINNPNDVELFINNVSIIDSFINDTYIQYL